MEQIKQGYKQTDIGVIPEDWKVGKIHNFCSMKSGISITSERISARGEYPCYGGNGLRGYTNSYTHNGRFTLVGRQGALCGNVNYITGKFFASEHAIVTTPLSKNDALFLAYSFERMNLNQYTESSAQPGLSVNKVLELPMCCPSTLAEQTAIATALSDVDTLIATLDKKITKKQQMKQGAMQQLLTGKKRLAGYCEEWVKKTLGEVARIISGGTPNTNTPSYWDGDILWCTPTDITSCSGKYLFNTERKITYEGMNNSSASLLPIGTLLLCSRATIGEVCIAGEVITTNQGFKSLICYDDYSNEYLYYMIPSLKQQMLEVAIGSTFLEVSKSNIEKITLYIPPSKSEQTAIAQILTDMDNEIEKLQAERDKYKEIKAGMMQQLLTGKIRLI